MSKSPNGPRAYYNHLQYTRHSSTQDMYVLTTALYVGCLTIAIIAITVGYIASIFWVGNRCTDAQTVAYAFWPVLLVILGGWVKVYKDFLAWRSSMQDTRIRY